MSDAHAAVLPRTPLSVTETHHYSHGRYSVWPKVYFQDTQGRIRTVDGNDGGESKVAVDTANINSRFAAISWGGPETGIQQEERLYFTNRDGRIYEYCWNSSRGWYQGELNGQYRAASYSSIAASVYGFDNNRLRHILLYYQAPDTNVICELIKNGWNSWTQGTTHPAGIKGTSIAADSRPDGARIWYQLPDTKFVQYGFESGHPWKKGDFVSTVDHDHGASIAVAGRYNVHTVAKGNKLALTVYNQKTGHWEPTKVLIDQIPSASLAAITHPKHYSNTFTSTVYTQQRPSEITKVQFNSDNTWKESLLPVTL